MRFTTNDNITITINEPDEINFDEFPANQFLEKIYRYLYSMLDNTQNLFQINFDNLDYPLIESIIQRNNPRLTLKKINGKKISTSEWSKNPIQKSLVLFFSIFPNFNLFIKNIHADPEINIKNAETLINQETSPENFLLVKRKIDEINNLKWDRTLEVSESQAGVSILGSVSEILLERAMESLIDNSNFFRSQNQDVQSYGDFVLMCLPNNLWISVKSNFARERLLASGYTTDIIGVGYFTDFNEFTSQTKIRNFIKVGFLAMYIPDIPITEEQITGNTSTFQQALNYYQTQQRELPKNINGKNFLRPLSQLYNDLNSLLDIQDIKRRTTVRY
ncbi:hypothetical protein ACOL3G_11155 [Aliarcobacter butzleri]